MVRMGTLKESLKREEIIAFKAELREFVQEAVTVEMTRILPQFVKLLVDELEARQQKPALQLDRQDSQIAGIVRDIWRDQGRQAVRTKAVANRMNYSPEWTLRLLKQAEYNGAITSIAGRGNRHSGRFLPVEDVA